MDIILWECKWKYCLFVWLVSMEMCFMETDVMNCIWRSSISATLPLHQEVYPNKECEQGEIWWLYPRGSLLAIMEHESQGREFNLCLTSNQQFNVSKIEHHTTARNVTVPIPNIGVNSCVLSEQGIVQLMFDADSDQHRIAVISYHRKPP